MGRYAAPRAQPLDPVPAGWLDRVDPSGGPVTLALAGPAPERTSGESAAGSPSADLPRPRGPTSISGVQVDLVLERLAGGEAGQLRGEQARRPLRRAR
jgi:hypothetical protein